MSENSETLYHQNGRFNKKRNRRRNVDQDSDSDERYEERHIVILHLIVRFRIIYKIVIISMGNF